MAPSDKRRFWHTCRVCFRRVRICAWTLLLVLLGALWYLNHVGLPGFLKRPILEKLRARGLDLRFQRLRYRLDHGLVAEHVIFGSSDNVTAPRLTADEVAVHLNYWSLFALHLQVDSLLLRQGHLIWPIADTNAPGRELTLDKLQTELRLLPGDVWSLDQFHALFAGAEFELAGTITNASRIREWKAFQAKPHLSPGALQRQLRRLADAVAQTSFPTPPRLTVDMRGDALDLYDFRVLMNLRVPAAETPWGTLQRGIVTLLIKPATNRVATSEAEIRLLTDGAQTSWGLITNLALDLHLVAAEHNAEALVADMSLEAGQTETRWGVAASTRVKAQWIHSFTTPIPLSGHGVCHFTGVDAPQGSAQELEFGAAFSASTNPPPRDASWAWWTNLASYVSSWNCRMAGFKSPRLSADEILCRGQWQAPELQVTQIVARLYGGRLQARAGVNVSNRRADFTLTSAFDVQRISPLLTEKSRAWLAQFTWTTPPALQAEGQLTLPAWTNRHPDWRVDIKPTVAIHGEFHLTNATFRSISTLTAESHFSYSNEFWRLPDLVVKRPEGQLNAFHESNERNRDYYFRVRSTLSPEALRPLLGANQQRGFDIAHFNQPPLIEGEVWGRWYDDALLGVRARVAATNFAIRGQPIDGFQSSVRYTNKVLTLTDPRLQREQGTQLMAADSVSADFVSRFVYITNGVSTADPLAVARAIGPKTGRNFEPYHFLQPPVVHVEGAIPTREPVGADLHFDVQGREFAWWKLKASKLDGRVDWVDDKLMLQNVRAGFYRGSATGEAEFHLRPGDPTTYHFDTQVKDADLHLLMQDLLARTNYLEGLLNGKLTITHAEAGKWQVTQGKGRVNLRDGLIWQIPLFGILSPVLDGIAPGMGSSRASEGSANFTITNGVVYSDNLEIRASVMRLQYWGHASLDGHVDARVQAELLRDTWVVGRLLSLALWPVTKVFQYQVTGTLHNPKIEPVFLFERIMLLPFHALHALKEPLPAPSGVQSETNAPPNLFP
jgi:hypothetical protein